ncbi:trihelix transcription factor ENAP1 [Malania oleifera]|uniref:trihelix transcription factor ENAP1 n=1 Tax=Malania oleifera TaxID=397392 RepID=UPI0025AE70FF|nr:trihelix transcription factor ENAP1 [Malania oleifera]
MDDTEDDARYPPKRYSLNHHPSFGPSHRSKLPIRNSTYPHSIRNQYNDVEDDEDDEENAQEEEDELEEDDDEVNSGYDDDEDGDDQNGYREFAQTGGSERYRKKRKLENLGGGYEFAPRVGQATAGTGAKSAAFGAWDWTEHATLALLEAWGDRFLQLGRKSLRSDDWSEVAEKVSETTKMERTDMQCRNRLDTLKKKYKKEKSKLEKLGNGAGASKWAYFKKMDMLMASSPRQQHGLACGVDSGEYVFMNPQVYLSRSNGFDEMRDSPGNSESSDGNDDDGDDSDGLPSRRRRFGEHDDRGSSFRLLADSIQKFGEIYEKIENSKRQQMIELEKMRMDFHRELELQKKQMLERANAEIAKIQQGDDEDTDASAENLSG